MNNIQERYLKAIQARVCRNCVDLLSDGTCGLHERVCPVERNLREIVQIVHHVSSESIQPYIDELRRVVCNNCENEDLEGHCPLRDSAGCALDRYFIMVIEAIEDVHAELKDEHHKAMQH